jgi:exodeoxyribonuclease-5
VPRSAGFASAGRRAGRGARLGARRVEAQPGARVGIVIPDLEARLPEVRRAARERLGVPDDESRSAAWNVSLGPPLADVPLVAAALGILALAWSSLGAGRRRRSCARATCPTTQGTVATLAPAASAAGSSAACAAFASTTSPRARASRRPVRRAPGVAAAARATPAHRVASRLDRRVARRAARGGWPGGERSRRTSIRPRRGSMSSRGVRDARCDRRGPRGARVSGADAVHALAQWAASTPFQPESPPAPVQIVGLIESIGLPFDALWIAGMGDDAWPRPARPHPLLPIGWQRDRGVPRSDAAAELAWAREVTSLWRRVARELVVSRAPADEQREAVASALFAPTVETTIAVPASAARAAFDARITLEPLDDARAPPLAAGESARATAATIEAQSACAFQALAAARWRAEPWPALAIGLTPAERGTLVHAALEALFADVRDSAALAALVADPGALARACAAAAERSLERIRPDRWREIPDAVRTGEPSRVARQLEQWLRGVEAARPPFAVRATEEKSRSCSDRSRFRCGSIASTRCRRRRVDPRLQDRHRAAGRSLDRRASRGDAARALRARVARGASGEPVRATAIGQVRPGECAVVGTFAGADCASIRRRRRPRPCPTIGRGSRRRATRTSPRSPTRSCAATRPWRRAAGPNAGYCAASIAVPHRRRDDEGEDA